MPTPVRGSPRTPITNRTPASAPGQGAPAIPKPNAVDTMDRTARTQITDGGRAAVPKTQRNFAAKEIAPGIKISGHGFAVGGRHSDVDAGVTQSATRVLYKAAQALVVLDKNPFKQLTFKERKATSAHLGDFLQYATKYRGRPSALSVRSRAASYALLVQVASSMSTRSEQPEGRKLIDQLLAAARSEPHPGLRRQMRLGLQALPKRMLTARQIREKTELSSSIAPSKPPYEKWFGDEASPTLKGKQYVQDEFWRKEIASYRKNGFKVETESDTKGSRVAIATRILQDPAGKAADVELTMKLVEKDEDVFGTMNDPELDIVFYTGHSAVGAVAQWSVDSAPEQRGDKLIGLFACRTKQNVNMVREQFPDAHVLVSDRGTYGNDDRIAIMELFNGIAARQGYAEISQAIEDGDIWEKDNYFLPHDTRQLKSTDFDGDGRSALSGGRVDLLFNTRLFNVKAKRGRGERITMKPSRVVPDPSGLDGNKIADTVGWFNSLYYYWAEEFGTPKEFAMADKFRADGWFTSDNPAIDNPASGGPGDNNLGDIVRIEEVKVRGEDPIYRVKVNAAYADQSSDSLAIMMTFALNQHISAQTRPDESEYDQRLRGLAFVSSYVANLVQFSDEGDALLGNFAKRFKFPRTLNYALANKAVFADHDLEASPKVLRALEKGLQYPFLEVNPNRTSVQFRTYVQGALDELKKSKTEIGRMTFNAISTGKVKIDKLTDLTRADFHRLRKEFLRDGLHLEPDDWYRLGNKRSRAHRAITSSIDGYMWDDRVYVSPGQSKKALAATLVHEVNHILNRSEENYRGDAAIFREEYRAFYSEALFRGDPVDDPAFCRQLKEQVIADYGIEGQTSDDLPDLPPGKFAPAASDETWGA